MGWFRGMKRKKFDFGEVHIPVDVSIPRISISFVMETLMLNIAKNA